MGEVINLRRVRKARARDEATHKAAENRALHGRSKGQRLAEQADADRAMQAIEGHRLEPGES